ncbi:MAG: amidohydrolase, partial [Caldilineaceae bacterium]|nr:amidohydrolase [Caldilineaceae bacterium]
YCRESAFRGPDANDYPANAPLTAQPGTKPDKGPAGSDLSLLREQALDGKPWQVAFGILNCAYRVASIHNPDLATALATAVNQWQVDHWLDKEPRLRASIVVPSQNPERAAAEIERWGEHPGFVQVVLPVRSDAPYGNLRYDPIYRAATQHDLVIGMQYGGAPGHPSTPVGWTTSFVEEYAGMAQVFQSQIISLIAEGVFDRFPDLRMTLIEAGFTWLPSLMWRIDKEWKGLRHNTPWVKRLPSEYMHDHLRFTTQPTDAPPNPEQLRQILTQLDSEELLLFGSDYPHHHAPHEQFDEPDHPWATVVDDRLLAKILRENARTWYRL